MFEGYCSRCGECCRDKQGIPVTRADMRRWKRLGRTDITETIITAEEDVYVDKMKLTRKGDMLLPVNDNYDCFHLERGENVASCSIYEHRPDVCERFPLIVDGNILVAPKKCVIPGSGPFI